MLFINLIILCSLFALLLFAFALVYECLEVVECGELLLIELVLNHRVELVVLQHLLHVTGALPRVHPLDLLSVGLPPQHEFVHLVVRGLVQVQTEFLLHIQIT